MKIFVASGMPNENMHSIPELQEIIAKAVADHRYPDKPKELYEPIKYILDLGGKRMRPVLLLMACNLFSEDVMPAVPSALAIEVFHNFTLMHDDIMDKAPLRRGKPTVHTKWNSSVGILSGDVMFVEAYKLMIQVDDSILRNVLAIFSDTASAVCEGQQMDMNFERLNTVSIEEYLDMIGKKTAVLLAGAMQIGALIGGADKEQSKLIYEFALNLGIAFQLQDDILDVYGDPEKFGKQVGGDIISNKKTFLLIKAQELATGVIAENLKLQLTSDAPQKVDKVRSIYDQLNVRSIATGEMNTYAGKAFEALEKINVPAEKKYLLNVFAEGLMKREN